MFFDYLTSHPTLPVSYSGIHGNAIIPKLERESHHGPPPPPLQEIKAGGKQLSWASRPDQSKHLPTQLGQQPPSQQVAACIGLSKPIHLYHSHSPPWAFDKYPRTPHSLIPHWHPRQQPEPRERKSLAVYFPSCHTLPTNPSFLRAFSSPRSATQHQQPVSVNANQKHLHT